MNAHSLRLDAAVQEVDVRGIEQPTGKVHAIIPSADGLTLVVKVPGFNYWSGRGDRSYAGAEFQLWQVVSADEDAEQIWNVRAIKVAEFAVKSELVPQLTARLRGIGSREEVAAR